MRGEDATNKQVRGYILIYMSCLDSILLGDMIDRGSMIQMISTVLMLSLHALLSSQLRDDLMTMLIAGHETTAAVLTWTFFCIVQNPQIEAKVTSIGWARMSVILNNTTM